MRCDIHGIEYDGFFGSCPGCKAAEQRQQEILDAHERSLEESRRQTEALERMHEAEQARAWEQQRALDAMAAKQQQGLEEQRKQRRVEEIRAALRAGLPEFPETFQQEWRRLNEQLGAVHRDENAFAIEQATQQKVLSQKQDALTTLQNSVRARIRSDFDRWFRSADKKQLQGLNGGQLLDARTIAAAAPTFAAVTHSTYLDSKTLSQSIPEHPAILILELETLGSVVGRARTQPDIGVSHYIGIGFLFFFALVSLAALLESIAPALRSPGGDVIQTLLTVFGIIWGVVGTILVGSYEAKKRARRRIEVEDFVRKCESLSSILLNTLPATPSWTRVAQADLAQMTDFYKLVANLGMDFREACRRLYIGLFELYFQERLSQQLEAADLSRLRAEIAEATGRLRQTEAQFEEASKTRALIKWRLAIARKMILLIGREIVEGIRVTGKGVRIAPCSHCSKFVIAELETCPYCHKSAAGPLVL